MKRALIVFFVAFFVTCGSLSAQEPGRYRFIFTSEDAMLDTTMMNEAGQSGEQVIQRSVYCDLDSDGRPESFTTSDDMCGSGGCMWTIYDGRSRQVLGEIFGLEVYVARSKPGTFPEIETYCRNGGDESEIYYYRYSKGEYVKYKTDTLRGEELDKYLGRKSSPQKEGKVRK